MTIPPLQAFIDAILAEPDDETHRLVCSDWLQDQGRFADAKKFRMLPGTAAVWCSDWGSDEHGLWCALRVKEVEQRLRWIKPGSFWMGSPEDEEGRRENEGPRHEVEIPRGFWIFDTPCTQQLWETVMQSTPSPFKGATHPVETVGWEDCHEFLSQLNQRIPGLALRLPREVQWEYACRAGTVTARYQVELDQIAWYRDNSNRETHPVKVKMPNRWGLYDMLGNVWEWCQDLWRDRYDSYAEESSTRVIRGGCWFNSVKYVRTASRRGNPPDYWSYFTGFRCIASSSSSKE